MGAKVTVHKHMIKKLRTFKFLLKNNFRSETYIYMENIICVCMKTSFDRCALRVGSLQLARRDSNILKSNLEMGL